MNRIISILIFYCLISCNNKDSLKNEENAVQQVLNFYNGECLKSKGFELENGSNISFYELEISNSELLNLKSQNLRKHSANIAYLFYSNLNNEKKNYDKIKVKINLSDGDVQEFSYSSDDLVEVEKIKTYRNQIVKNIMDNDYGSLIKMFDDSVSIKQEELSDLFSSIELQYGKVVKTQFQGFEYRESNNFGEVIVLNEALLYDKTALSMDIIFNKENMKVIAIEFN
jgi:hypothetical protein